MFIRILSMTYVVNVVYQLTGSKLSLQMYQYQDDCLYMYILVDMLVQLRATPT